MLEEDKRVGKFLTEVTESVQDILKSCDLDPDVGAFQITVHMRKPLIDEDDNSEVHSFTSTWVAPGYLDDFEAEQAGGRGWTH